MEWKGFIGRSSPSSSTTRSSGSGFFGSRFFGSKSSGSRSRSRSGFFNSGFFNSGFSFPLVIGGGGAYPGVSFENTDLTALKGDHFRDIQLRGSSIMCTHQRYPSLFSIYPIIINPLCICSKLYNEYFVKHSTIPFTSISCFDQITYVNPTHNVLNDILIRIGIILKGAALVFAVSNVFYWVSSIVLICLLIPFPFAFLLSLLPSLILGLIFTFYFDMFDGLESKVVVDWTTIYNDQSKSNNPSVDSGVVSEESGVVSENNNAFVNSDIGLENNNASVNSDIGLEK